MKVSETELAWVAAARALAAAERAEAPLLVGASAYHLGHTFLRAGRIREATDLTMDAAAALAPQPGCGARAPGALGCAPSDGTVRCRPWQ
jgi:hypothetical protein